MKDCIGYFVSFLRFPLELLVIFVRDVIKYFFNHTPPMPLKKEVILVAEGSKGIGREILRRLAIEEPDLTLISWDVNEEANKDVVKELKDLGAKRVMAYNVDVTNREQVSKTADEIRGCYGDVTMLFNTAGIVGPTRTCWQIASDQALSKLDINLSSHFYPVQEFLPGMLENNRGHIIGTCSILTFLKAANGLPCCASNRVLGKFYECLKAELCKSYSAKGIHVTSVYPGFGSTDLKASFNFESNTCPGLSSHMIPHFVANEVVKRVREHERHVLPIWRFVHQFKSAIPCSTNGATSSAMSIDSLNLKIS